MQFVFIVHPSFHSSLKCCDYYNQLNEKRERRLKFKIRDLEKMPSEYAVMTMADKKRASKSTGWGFAPRSPDSFRRYRKLAIYKLNLSPK